MVSISEKEEEGDQERSSKNGFVDLSYQPPRKTAGDVYKFRQSNEIHTTRYTYLTFIPLSAMYQLKRFAYVFFVLIAILQSIDVISPLTPVTAILPVVFLFGLAMIRDFIEEVVRRRYDHRLNTKMIQVAEAIDKDGNVQRTSWKEWKALKQGDIVIVPSGEAIPADLVLLRDSEQFIDTMNLDGESTWKRKQGSSDLLTLFVEGVVKLRVYEPEQNLHRFHIQAIYNQDVERAEVDQTRRISKNEIVLRGSTYHHSGGATGGRTAMLGIAVYVGHDTKEMLNAAKPGYKLSQVEWAINRIVVVLVLLVVVLALLGGLLSGLWTEHNIEEHYYLRCDTNECNAAFTGFLAFWTYFILLNTYVPSSLIVSMELLKPVHAFFISWDAEMDDVVCNTVTMSEQLGQTSYVFADKTGTLTKNEMKFVFSVIAGCIIDTDNLAFNMPPFFLLGLVACNDVVVIHSEDGQMTYHGSSTDEVALVSKSKQAFGIALLSRSLDAVEISQLDGTTVKYQQLVTLPFSSSRKRMSVVLVREDNPKQAIVLCKGADSVLLDRMMPESVDKDSIDALDDLSRKGYRTLIFGCKHIMVDQSLHDWLRKYEEAEDDTNGEVLTDFIESDLTFLGGTVIEDVLQDGVKETIERLREAGIAVWMLTGDKKETAIEIGRSCGLLSQNEAESILVLDSDDISDLQMTLRNHRASNVVITGKSLSFMIPTMEEIQGDISKQLYDVVRDARSVIVSRCSPMQKSLVVHFIHHFNPTIGTCAIGDGANDVSMIRAARVGIGVRGQDGFQAVRSAEFSIGRFRDLDRLLLFHGFLAYHRLTDFINYFFYKNIGFTTPLWFFGFYSAWSGQTFYDDYYIFYYNILFTAIPVFIRAVLDMPVKEVDITPSLYGYSQSNSNFTRRQWMSAVILGFFHALLFFFLPVVFMPYQMEISSDLWRLSAVSFITLVVIMLLYIAMDTKHYTVLGAVVYVVSFAFVLLVIYLNGVGEGRMVGIFDELVVTGSYYLFLLLMGVIVLGGIFAVKAYEGFYGTRDEMNILAARHLINARHKYTEIVE